MLDRLYLNRREWNGRRAFASDPGGTLGLVSRDVAGFAAR